ncbi:MAG TPA: transcription termination/antitermination protein NusA [Clostridiaceae bacterium]|jgi:N utilization substance protein A|nr:transcription termination/antitermination protein NusA [Clostridiaceae bacterium]
MSAELLYALDQLEKEKGIDKETIIDALEQALISAYKKNFGSAQSVEVSIDRNTGQIRVYALKTIVDEVTDAATEMSIEQARIFGPDFEVGDIVEVEVTPKKFGRIAAQTAKQVVMQRIREAERGLIFDEFANREEDIVNGVVSRFDRKNVVIDLGKAEAVLPPSEQTPGEKYNIHDRIKVYVINVKKTNKNPQIYVSRTHPGLVKRLLELEVPEIADGTVEIKTIAREAGSRTKISIFSRNENVDPVGACVGQRGGRIRAIVDELRGEMIDVIKWSQSDEEYIAASLSPAKVLQVDLDEENKVARVVVPDFQLSLAIGKEGQNARLAAKLTGWKIDIKSESQLRNQIESQLFNLDSISYEDDEYEADLDEVTEVSGDTEPEQEYNAEEDLDAAEEKNYDQEADAVEDTDVPDEEISEQETEAEIEPEEKV